MVVQMCAYIRHHRSSGVCINNFPSACCLQKDPKRTPSTDSDFAIGAFISASRVIYLHRLGFSFEEQSKELCFHSELHVASVIQFWFGHV